MRHESFEAPLAMQWHAEKKARMARWSAIAIGEPTAAPRPKLVPVVLSERWEEQQRRRAFSDMIATKKEAERQEIERKEKEAIHSAAIEARKYPLIDDIIFFVAEAFEVSPADIKGTRYTRGGHRGGPDVVTPRHVAMYLSREMTPKSYPAIAPYIGRRDHTTIMAGHHSIVRRMATDPALRAQVAALRAQLQPAQVERGVAE